LRNYLSSIFSFRLGPKSLGKELNEPLYNREIRMKGVVDAHEKARIGFL